LSPALQRFGEARVIAGDRVLVVDLGGCSGMDSTFMGTLAALAKQLDRAGGGILQVAGVSERNRRSMEELGLDYVLQIDPEGAVWRERIEDLRSDLAPVNGGSETGARHVLDAHRVLAESSDANREKFRGVIEVLEAELATEHRAG
jgi:anti-anti-sigma regulatory factor